MIILSFYCVMICVYIKNLAGEVTPISCEPSVESVYKEVRMSHPSDTSSYFILFSHGEQLALPPSDGDIISILLLTLPPVPVLSFIGVAVRNALDGLSKYVIRAFDQEVCFYYSSSIGGYYMDSQVTVIYEVPQRAEYVSIEDDARCEVYYHEFFKSVVNLFPVYGRDCLYSKLLEEWIDMFMNQEVIREEYVEEYDIRDQMLEEGEILD